MRQHHQPVFVQHRKYDGVQEINSVDGPVNISQTQHQNLRTFAFCSVDDGYILRAHIMPLVGGQLVLDPHLFGPHQVILGVDLFVMLCESCIQLLFFL